MKRTDIERMISLVDDRYIDEIFQDKITGKRRNIFVTFAAVAAALAVVAVGIGYLVSNAGNADKITADDPIVSEFGIVDYSLYFQNKDESAVEVEGDVGVLAEATGISCYFSDSEYVKSVMPFDISGFANAECRFAYDYKDYVSGIMIHADNRTDDNQENVKMLDVEVYEQGELFPHLSLGKCKSMKRFDVDVYGFDFRETDNVVGVIFASNGKEYLIGGDHMSFDEIGLIMDSIIENGLWADSFDLSKAEIEYGDISADITLGEANFIEPFAGHVPQHHKFGDMTLNFNKVSYYAGRDENYGIVPQWLYFTYYDGGDRDICLQYFTDDANVQPLEKTAAIENIDLDKLSEFRGDGNNHAFTIDFGDFKVNVWTNNCNDEELLECITAMRAGESGAEGSSSKEISLSKANHIIPFEGYVPQTDSIGTMRVTSVYYDESTYIGGGDIAVIVSLMDDNDKHMLIHYGTFEEKVRDKYVSIAEVYDRFESFSEQSEYNADCRYYSFTIDCGYFWIKISADCTPEEMQEFLNIIITTYEFGIGSLEYSNKLEPFAGYVPLDKTGYNRDKTTYTYDDIDGEPTVINMHLDFSEGESHIMLDYRLYDVSFGSNGEDAIPLKDITPEKLEPIFGDGTNGGFSIDCGKFFIVVHTENCSADDVWAYVSEINGNSKQVGVRMSNGINLVDSTLLAANNIKPFAGYIPQSESFGSLKLSAVSEGYFDGNASPCLIHMVYVDDFDNPKQMLTAHFYSDYKAVFLDEPKYSAVPLAELSSEKIKGLGKSFVLDCGDFEILIGASLECSEEDIWRFINGVKGLTTYDAGYDAEDEDVKILTIYKVKELAKKGDDLTWSDFEEFRGKEVGSGLFIMAYNIEGTDFTVLVGGAPNEKPMYIYLKDGEENQIDIRYDSIDDFLSEKMLTMDNIKELAKKGDDLMWDDFDGYVFSEGGSGLYIRMYNVKGGYTLAIGGGGPDKKPMYINLGDGNGNHIDIRYDSIDKFLNEN